MKPQGTYVQVPDALMTETKLPVSAVMVWIAMAHFANDKNECYAKIDSLVLWSHCSRRTVMGALETLEKSGYVQKLHRTSYKTYLYLMVEPHTGKSCTYAGKDIVVERMDATIEANSAPIKGANSAPSKVQILHVIGANSAPDLDCNNLNGNAPRKDTPPTPKKAPRAEPKYSVTFDYDAGEFSMTEEARQKLERDWPDVDLDVEIRKAEGWVLDQYNKNRRVIQNGLSFLSKWLGKPGAQRKAAGTMTITSGALAGKTVDIAYGGASQGNKRPTPPASVDMSKIIKGA